MRKEKAATEGLEVRRAQLSAPHPGSVTDTRADHALLSASLFPAVSEEMKLACVHGSHPDCARFSLYFSSLALDTDD